MDAAARTVLLLLVLAFVAPRTALAGAWAKKEGAYYLKLAALTATYDEQFDADGERVPRAGMGELSDFNLSAYLEYGLTDEWTLVASAPYRRLSEQRTFAGGIARERNRRFGDLEVRLLRPLRLQPLVTSVAIGGKIPLYSVGEGTRVPLGTGEPDADVRLLLGRSFHPAPLYSTGEIGLRVRGGEFSNETFFSFETGLAVGRLLLKGQVSAVRTLGTCGSAGQAGVTGDQDMLKWSPGMIYALPGDTEMSFEFIQNASGCNTTRGTTWAIGVAKKR